MSGQDPTPELAALEGQLRLLAPREGSLDRDALLYRAGQASARGGWLWPLTAAVSTLTAVALGVALASHPGPRVVERVVYVPVERPAPEAPRDTSVGEPISPEPARPIALHELPPHLRLREQLLRWGLDGLGEAPVTSAPAPHARDLLSHYAELSKGEPLP
jgi:hypothetical protein